MGAPKRIDEITIEDLRRSRWCYFNDDKTGFDAFEWVIPESHPKFSRDVSELELARFRFQGGQEVEGMFDGSKCFSIYLGDNWHSLWHGSAPPRSIELAGFKAALSELGLALPVVAKALWSGKSECYGGLRYYDLHGNEVEV